MVELLLPLRWIPVRWFVNMTSRTALTHNTVGGSSLHTKVSFGKILLCDAFMGVWLSDRKLLGGETMLVWMAWMIYCNICIWRRKALCKNKSVYRVLGLEFSLCWRLNLRSVRCLYDDTLSWTRIQTFEVPKTFSQYCKHLPVGVSVSSITSLRV